MNSTCMICGVIYGISDDGCSPNMCSKCVSHYLKAVDSQNLIKELLTESNGGKEKIEELRSELETSNLNIDLLSYTLLGWNGTNLEKLDLKFRFLESLSISEINKAIHHIQNTSSAIKYKNTLDATKGEREIAVILDGNHKVLRQATGYYHEGEAAFCFKEFQFGSDYVADFVILSPRRSLPPLVNLVELEPVDDPVFTKKGTPSSRLVTAINQVKQWTSWIHRNPMLFSSELAKRSNQSIDQLQIHNWMRLSQIEIQSFVFIGRRACIQNEYRALWNSSGDRLTIHSYDTFINIMIDNDMDTLLYNGNLTHGISRARA